MKINLSPNILLVKFISCFLINNKSFFVGLLLQFIIADDATGCEVCQRSKVASIRQGACAVSAANRSAGGGWGNYVMITSEVKGQGQKCSIPDPSYFCQVLLNNLRVLNIIFRVVEWEKYMMDELLARMRLVRICGRVSVTNSLRRNILDSNWSR
jgi:hypothetical protein